MVFFWNFSKNSKRKLNHSFTPECVQRAFRLSESCSDYIFDCYWFSLKLSFCLSWSQQVYNVTEFLEDHSGGDEVLLSGTGNKSSCCIDLVLCIGLPSVKSPSQQVRMQRMILKMLVIARAQEKWWTNTTLERSTPRRSQKGRHTQLQSSLTTIRIRQRSSSSSSSSSWFLSQSWV